MPRSFQEPHAHAVPTLLRQREHHPLHCSRGHRAVDPDFLPARVQGSLPRVSRGQPRERGQLGIGESVGAFRAVNFGRTEDEAVERFDDKLRRSMTISTASASRRPSASPKTRRVPARALHGAATGGIDGGALRRVSMPSLVPRASARAEIEGGDSRCTTEEDLEWFGWFFDQGFMPWDEEVRRSNYPPNTSPPTYVRTLAGRRRFRPPRGMTGRARSRASRWSHRNAGATTAAREQPAHIRHGCRRRAPQVAASGRVRPKSVRRVDSSDPGSEPIDRGRHSGAVARRRP